jgi:hypothetical protein
MIVLSAPVLPPEPTEASKKANVKHYVMVSTYDSRREAFDASGDLKPYT